jgi:hypothetical protein
MRTRCRLWPDSSPRPGGTTPRQAIVACLLLFTATVTAKAQELEPDRSVFRVGVAELTPIEVPVEYRFVAATIPRLVVESLQGIVERRMSEPEVVAYAELRIEHARRDAMVALTDAIDRRAALLFDRDATEERIATAEDAVSSARSSLTTLEQLTATDLESSDMRPVEFWARHADGQLMAAVSAVPAETTSELRRIAEADDLDLLVFGSIEEIVGYLAVDIYVYHCFLDRVTLVGGTVGLPEEVGEDARLIADDVATTILGRPWSTLIVDTPVPDARIQIDGTLVGFGSADGRYLMPGEHTVEVSAVGYADITASVTTEPSETKELTLAPQSSVGRTVLIESAPAGAAVYVDSVYTGTTPLSVDFGALPALVRIQRDGYLESRFVVDGDTPETVARALIRDTIDWTAEIEQSRKQFYRSLAWFILSVPVTLALRGGYLNVFAAFPPTDDGSLDPDERIRLARLGNILYWSSITGVLVNVGLFANTILGIRDYIEVGEGSHNQ